MKIIYHSQNLCHRPVRSYRTMPFHGQKFHACRVCLMQRRRVRPDEIVFDDRPGGRHAGRFAFQLTLHRATAQIGIDRVDLPHSLCTRTEQDFVSGLCKGSAVQNARTDGTSTEYQRNALCTIRYGGSLHVPAYHVGCGQFPGSLGRPVRLSEVRK